MNCVQPALVAIVVSCGFEANSQEGHWLVQARTAVFMRNDNASSCDAKKRAPVPTPVQQRQMAHVAMHEDRMTNRPKCAPRWLQMAQNPPQDSPRWPKMAPRWPKIAQDELQDGPRSPRSAPRRPKMTQDGPKMAQRWPKDGR